MTTLRPAVFLMLAALVVAQPVSFAMAQDMSVEDITLKLKKKKLTRSLKKDTTAADLDAVLSRSIGVVERKEIVEITKKAELPSLDFTINFAFDSAEIDQRSYPTLDALAAALKGQELYDSRFLVNGHTDSKGSDDYNIELSQRRADAVVAYLADEHGINKGRLKAIGFGESALKDTYDSEAAANRRVEIINRP